MFAGYIAMTTGAIYLYFLNRKQLRMEEIEHRSANNAIFPLLLAERDREYLKQLRRNRDEEADLMKNVKGWEVGTYYGDSIYKTLPDDFLIQPDYFEYYVHASTKDYSRKGFLHSNS